MMKVILLNEDNTSHTDMNEGVTLRDPNMNRYKIS